MVIQRKKQRKQHSKQGFTLVELIVTLAILGIIAGIAVPSITGYIRHAQFTKNNSYAQTIFYAAQSSLNHYKANGQLEALKTYNTTGDGKDKIVNSSMVTGVGDAMNAYGDRLHYLMLAPDSVETEAQTKQFHQLVDDYIYDKSILAASICIEYDPADAVVYSVSYSDRAAGFTYDLGDKSEKDTGIVSISDRTESVRKKRMLGYYDVQLAKQAPSSLGRPTFKEVKLVNEETLTLQWALKDQYADMTEQFTYNIELHDKTTRKLLLSMQVNQDGKKIQPEGAREGNMIQYTATVTTYGTDGKGVEKTYSDYPFLAYGIFSDKDKTKRMILTLDALDLAATSGKPDATKIDPNKETLSITRLGIEPGSVYARVKATGGQYKDSAWKQSNNSHTYFDAETSTKTAGVDKNTYNIKNARHFSNIRYIEEKREGTASASPAITYQQNGNFSWSGKNSILENKHVYDGKKIVADQKKEFPEIKTLSTTSAYIGKTGKTEFTMRGFILKSINTENPLGLFATNKGSIMDTKLTDATVTGINSVGILCGVNEGILKGNITSGKVSGSANVGGIAGKGKSGATFETLTNHANVIGKISIGGIVGSISNASDVEKTKKESSSTILKCKNYGMVRSAKVEETETVKEKERKYIGGIIGFNPDALIKECMSTPILDVKEADLADETLYGDYVGGIVGYSQKGAIVNCSTGNKDANNRSKKAYVIGRNYVGGIVGFMEEGTLNNDKVQSNKANVLGEKFVGGILGANVRLENNKIPDPDDIKSSYNAALEVKNWKNEGVVSARAAYAGGIAGYNAGNIINCVNQIDTSAQSGETLLQNALQIKSQGDYAGGMVGYNDGAIFTENPQEVNSVVAGKNYVGGIVGYNNQGERKNIDGTLTSSMSGYTLKAGYMNGNCFVGGMIGLNSNADIFSDHFSDQKELKSNPNAVKGSYFVGGVLGGNIIAGEDEVSMLCKTNNFLGTVSADTGAFAGGYIGYNQRVASGTNVKKTREDLCAATSEGNLDLSGKIDKVVKLGEGKVQGAFILSSNSPIGLEKNKHNMLALVRAQLYAGGIVGYNASGTHLTIENIDNATPVQTTKSITDATLADSEDMNETQNRTYAYTGGMIGKVTPYMHINNCKNADAGVISSAGTYTGGITEVNQGSIEGCEVGNVSGNSYVGGIAGLNDSGSILNCQLTGLVDGASNVGGIVSRNQEGTIKKCQILPTDGITASVMGTGTNIGGIAAVNTGTNTFIEECTVKGNVTGTGTNVGGIVGYNHLAKITVVSNNSETIKPVQVRGNANVGGIVGYNKETNLGMDSNHWLENDAVVYAETDNAGGIVGLQEGAQIRYARNKVSVSSDSGMAAGITAHNSGTIDTCENEGNIKASTNKAAGIAAENTGTISNITLKQASIKGQYYAGGIAALNMGRIINARIEANPGRTLQIENIEGDTRVKSYVGGIAAYNAENTSITGMSINQNFSMTATASNVEMGAVVGHNEGVIDGVINGNPNMIYGPVDLAGKTGSIGGIAGVNLGTIQNVTYTGNVNGTQGNQYGIGGIAGINGDGTAEAKIINCNLNGNVIGKGTGTNVKNMAYAGGIAGQNKLNAEVRNATLATDYQTEVRAIYGYIGGLIGYNEGAISNYGITGFSNQKVTIGTIPSAVEASSIVGGIIGTNASTGEAHGVSTGKAWEITNIANANQTFATGGIIGSNESSKNLDNLRNRAKVNSNTSQTGGVIGAQSNTTAEGVVLYECRNEGNVTSDKAGVGGVIGLWQNYGGNLKSSGNAATITSTYNGEKNGRVGGVIGEIRTNSVNMKVFVEYTGNDGNLKLPKQETKNEKKNGNYIRDKYVGGIVGYIDSVQPSILNVRDCYNAAVLPNSYTSAGIVGYVGAAKKTKVNLTNCINYGTAEKLAGEFKGIYGGDSEASMSQCFNIAKTKNVLSRATEDGQNFGITGVGSQYAKDANFYITYQENRQPIGFYGGTEIGNRDGWNVENQKNHWLDRLMQEIPLPYHPITGMNHDGSYTKENQIYANAYDGLGTIGMAQKLKNDFRLTIDNYYSKYYSQDEKKLFAVWYPIITEHNGTYTLKWGADLKVHPRAQEIKIYKKGDAEPSQTISIEGDLLQTDFTVDSSWKVGTEFYATIQRMANTPNGNSDIVKSELITVLPQLPTPVVSYIIDYNKAGEVNGHFLLENPQDYIEADRSVIVEYSNGDTNAGGEPVKKQVTLTANKPQQSVTLKNQENLVTTTWAKSTDKNYSSSNKVEGYTFLCAPNATRKATYVKDTGKLTGIGIEDLRYEYQVQNEGANNGDGLVYRSDVLFEHADKSKKLLSETTFEMPSGHETATADLDFNTITQQQLEEIAGKDITVRRYPWEVGIARYYQDVKDGGNGSYLNGQAFHNVVFAHPDGFTFGGEKVLEEITVTMPEMQPKVIIEEVKEDENNNYLFTWIDGKGVLGNQGPRYDVRLLGHVKGTEKDKFTEITTVKNTIEKKLKVDATTWNYDSVKLIVSCRGIIDGNTSETLRLTSVTEKSFDIIQRLSTISRPSVSLKDNSALIYDVTWSSLTDKEQLAALKEYKVTATAKDSDIVVTKTVTDKDTFATDLDLNQFPAQAEISVTVMAVASKDSGYIDSIPSAPFKFTLPTRMTMPTVTGTMAHGYDSVYGKGISYENLDAQGLLFEVKTASVESGNYEGEAVITQNEKDAIDAGETLTPRIDSFVMEGNLTSAQRYVLGITPDDAGRWVHIRLRATSPSQIASTWSEWMSFRLPKMKLVTADVTVNQVENTISQTEAYWDGTAVQSGFISPNRNTILTWSPTSKVDGYQLNIQTLATTTTNVTPEKNTTVFLHRAEAEAIAPFEVWIPFAEMDSEFREYLNPNKEVYAHPAYVKLPFMEPPTVNADGSTTYLFQIPSSVLLEGPDENHPTQYAYKMNVAPRLECTVTTANEVSFAFVTQDTGVHEQNFQLSKAVGVRAISWTDVPYYEAAFQMAWQLKKIDGTNYIYGLQEINDTATTPPRQNETDLHLPETYTELTITAEEYNIVLSTQLENTKKLFPGGASDGK